MATILYQDPDKMSNEELLQEIDILRKKTGKTERPFRYGGMAGGVAGSLIGGRVAGAPGSAIGAGVLSGAGEFAEQVARGENIDYGAIKDTAIENIAGDIGGDIATRGVIKAVSPYGHRLVKDAKDIASNLAEYGGYPTLNMMVKSGPVAFATRMAEQGMGSAEKMGKFFDESVIEPVKKYGTAVRKGIGNYLEPEARGTVGKKLMKLGHSLASESVKPMYKEADELFGMPVVPKTDAIKATALEYIRRAEDPNFGAKTFGTKEFLGRAKQVLKWPDYMYFEKAHNERSSLLSMSRQAQDLMTSYDEAFVKKMVSSINDAMEQGASYAHQMPMDVTTVLPERSMFAPTKFIDYTKTHTKTIDPREGFKAYRRAADKYAEIADIYDDPNIVSIYTSKDGVKAAGKMLPAKSPEIVNKVLAAIRQYNPSKEADQYIKDLRASWFEDILEKKGLDIGGESTERLGVELQDKFSKKLDTEKILEEFNKYGETFDIIAGENKPEISKFFRTLQAVEQHKKGGGPGQVFIAMKYAAAPGLGLSGIGTLISGHPLAGVSLIGSSAAIIVTPELMGQILTNKTMLKLLTNTLITPSRPALRELGKTLGKFYMNQGEEMKKKESGAIDTTLKYVSDLPSNL